MSHVNFWATPAFFKIYLAILTLGRETGMGVGNWRKEWKHFERAPFQSVAAGTRNREQKEGGRRRGQKEQIDGKKEGRHRTVRQFYRRFSPLHFWGLFFSILVSAHESEKVVGPALRRNEKRRGGIEKRNRPSSGKKAGVANSSHFYSSPARTDTACTWRRGGPSAGGGRPEKGKKGRL